jgi:hypothetical protein
MKAQTWCCAHCFGDSFLSSHITNSSTRNGQCSYCGENGVALIEPIELRDRFELLASVYVQDDGGKLLVDLLKEDWALFENENLRIASATLLILDILDNSKIARETFSVDDSARSTALALWNELREELKHSNRFFPKTDIPLDRLGGWLQYLLHSPAQLSREWYRARISENGDSFELDNMGSPPKKSASNGRANPVGIPYLYLASDKQTAISEVRPQTGHSVCVAKFELQGELKIIDLRHPRLTISPFYVEDEAELARLRADIELLEKLGQELTRPVLQSAAAFDYIPSQYLCEFVKSMGWDGVMYRSSVGNGVNIALFDTLRAQAISSTMSTVVGVNFVVDEEPHV